jgi:Transposase and inactivated derivatives
MSLRLEFVTLANQPDANVRLLCQRFRISPTTAYKWLKRFRDSGPAALADRSRRPHHSPDRTNQVVEEQIVKLRQQHPAWGARKLRQRLTTMGCRELPAMSTITDILHRHGLIWPEGSEPTQSHQRFERSAPNQLWQLDFKGHFALPNGRCHPLCVLDDHSRYNVLLRACADERRQTVQQALVDAFRMHGLPSAVLCDNGSPWGSTGTEYTGLGVWLLRLGIQVYHGRAYHPQTQGKQERFHRTLQAEVLARGGWQDCGHVQREFDRWRPVYNSQRPHEALDLAVPLSRYKPSQRSYPEQLPALEYDVGVEVRRVNSQGWIKYRGQVCPVGTGFAGQQVAVRPTSIDGVIEILFGAHTIKTVDLRSLEHLKNDC